jgi:hypothetical protein
MDGRPFLLFYYVFIGGGGAWETCCCPKPPLLRLSELDRERVTPSYRVTSFLSEELGLPTFSLCNSNCVTARQTVTDPHAC